nr:MAG TPA: hypothetical protein [Bacteriophage sp.]
MALRVFYWVYPSLPYRYTSIVALYSSHTRFRALPISTYTSNCIRPLATSISL